MPPAGAGTQPGAMGPKGQQPGLAGPQPEQRGVRTPYLQTLTIEDIIQTDVVTAERDTPIQTIAAKMAQENVGAVVIVEDEEPVSILTDRKIALSLENITDIEDVTADDLISGDIVTGTSVMTVFEVLQQLSEEYIRRFPIVDEDGRLEGIVTLDDILVLLSTELHDVADIIKAQSPHY